MDLFDVEAAERVESELDRIVAKRAREAKDAAAIEEAWKQSARAHREKRREARRQEWCDFHRHMQALHTGLAEEHAEKAAMLGEGEP